MPAETPEQRVKFEHPIPVQIMAIDGTWRRACELKSVSDFDAVLIVEGSVQGLSLKEFFLLLSSTGLAYRRCELACVNGDEIGVNFLRNRRKQKKSPEPTDVI